MATFDPLTLLRLSSIVDSLPGVSPLGPSPYDNPGETNPSGITGLSFTPQTAERDRLDQLLANYPQQQPASFMQKLAAGLIGGATGLREGAAAGVKAGQGFLDQNYNQALTDWMNQAKVQQQAATDENAANNTARALAAAQMQSGDREAALQAKITKDQADIANAQKRTDIYAAKEQIAAKVAKGGTLQIQPNGSAVMVYKDGTFEPLVGADGKNLQLTSPQEMQELKDKDAMARAQVAAQAAMGRSVYNQENANARADQSGIITFTGPDGKLYTFNPKTMQTQEVKDLPSGSQRVGTQSNAGTGSTTTSTTTTTEPPGVLGKIFGAKPTVKSEKTTTTTKTSNNNVTGTAKDPQIRARVAADLKAHNLPFDDAAIDKMLANSKNRTYYGVK